MKLGNDHIRLGSAYINLMRLGNAYASQTRLVWPH